MGRRPRTRQGSEESKKYLQNIMKTLYFCQKFEINQQSFFMIKSILFFIHLDPDTAYDKRPLCQKPKVMSWSMNLSIRLLLNVLQTFDKIKCFYEILLIFVTLTFEPCLVLGLLPTAPSWRGRPFCRFTGEGTAWDGVQKRTGRIKRSLKMSARRPVEPAAAGLIPPLSFSLATWMAGCVVIPKEDKNNKKKKIH